MTLFFSWEWRVKVGGLGGRGAQYEGTTIYVRGNLNLEGLSWTRSYWVGLFSHPLISCAAAGYTFTKPAFLCSIILGSSFSLWLVCWGVWELFSQRRPALVTSSAWTWLGVGQVSSVQTPCGKVGEKRRLRRSRRPLLPGHLCPGDRAFWEDEESSREGPFFLKKLRHRAQDGSKVTSPVIVALDL